MGTAGFEPGDRKSPVPRSFLSQEEGRIRRPAIQGAGSSATRSRNKSRYVYPLHRGRVPLFEQERRVRIANDPLTLLASDRSSDSVKGDSGPSEWLPPNRGIHCAPSVRFAQVAASTNYP